MTGEAVLLEQLQPPRGLSRVRHTISLARGDQLRGRFVFGRQVSGEILDSSVQFRTIEGRHPLGNLRATQQVGRDDPAPDEVHTERRSVGLLAELSSQGGLTGLRDAAQYDLQILGIGLCPLRDE